MSVVNYSAVMGSERGGHSNMSYTINVYSILNPDNLRSLWTTDGAFGVPLGTALFNDAHVSGIKAVSNALGGQVSQRWRNMSSKRGKLVDICGKVSTVTGTLPTGTVVILQLRRSSSVYGRRHITAAIPLMLKDSAPTVSVKVPTLGERDSATEFMNFTAPAVFIPPEMVPVMLPGCRHNMTHRDALAGMNITVREISADGELNGFSDYRWPDVRTYQTSDGETVRAVRVGRERRIW